MFDFSEYLTKKTGLDDPFPDHVDVSLVPPSKPLSKEEEQKKKDEEEN